MSSQITVTQLEEISAAQNVAAAEAIRMDAENAPDWVLEVMGEWVSECNPDLIAWAEKGRSVLVKCDGVVVGQSFDEFGCPVPAHEIRGLMVIEW